MAPILSACSKNELLVNLVVYGWFPYSSYLEWWQGCGQGEDPMRGMWVLFMVMYCHSLSFVYEALLITLGCTTV